MTRTPPIGSVPLVVLRPKIGWRLTVPPLAAILLAVQTNWIKLDDGPMPWWGWASVAVSVALAMAVWRERIELHPGIIFRRGVVGWAPAMRAEEVEEVVLHYDVWGRDWPHRVLTFHTYAPQRSMRVSFRWWSRWWLLIRWLTTYCTRVEEGERVWGVRTDGKTRDRLELFAQPLLIDKAWSE